MAGRFTRTEKDRGSDVRVLDRESQPATTKVERERDFHNKSYTESTRRRIWGFYDTNNASHDHFQKLVRGSNGLSGAPGRHAISAGMANSACSSAPPPARAPATAPQAVNTSCIQSKMLRMEPRRASIRALRSPGGMASASRTFWAKPSGS